MPPTAVNIWREDRYQPVLSTPSKSPLLSSIWREAYREEYPEEADPFGFATISDLQSLAKELRLEPGSQLADIGCGRGGPGLWVARKTGCFLDGIDIVPEAIEQANQRRIEMGMTHAAIFRVGTFSDTGLPTTSQGAVMTVDAFWMVLDKPAALRETARILSPGGRVGMTTWVARGSELETMLTNAGFQVLLSAETLQWKERQMAVYRGILRNRATLELEIGRAATEVLVAEARGAPVKLAGSARQLVVAELRR
jgi:cyclopropane fatty-acyl-phospholipid synthase-like methyltransferase